MKKRNIVIMVGSGIIILILVVLIILSKERKVTCKINYENEYYKINYKYVITYKYLMVENVMIDNKYKLLYKTFNYFTNNVLNNKEKEEMFKEYKKMAINGNKYKGIGYKVSRGLDYINMDGNIDYKKIDFKKLKKDKNKVSEIKINKNDTIIKYKKELKKQGYECK